MRDVHEVLREKEQALERVRREAEALRIVAPLLAQEVTDSLRQQAIPKDATTGEPIVVPQRP